MLKDRFFYPLAFALIAAMVWYALSRADNVALSEAEILANGFETRGDKLITLTASPGTNYEFVGATANNPAHIIAFTEIPRKTVWESGNASAGIFATLSPDYERVLAGQNLRITMRARQGRNNPLTEFDMGYFVASAGLKDSGWQRRSLSEDWQNYTFDFMPEFPNADPDIDYLGFWPGEEGEQKTMHVEFMKIDVLPKAVN